MSKLVKFGELLEGDFFVARGKFHVKQMCREPRLVGKKERNAFYYDGSLGLWSHFDAIALVQRYDATIHGQPAEIIRLRDRQVS
jgi:hypothetical protein